MPILPHRICMCRLSASNRVPLSCGCLTLHKGYTQESKPPFPRVPWEGRASASWDAPQRSISPGGVSGARGFGGAEANGAASLDAVPPLARPQPFLPPHLRHSSGSTDAALDALGGAHRSQHGWRGREWGGELPSDRGVCRALVCMHS